MRALKPRMIECASLSPGMILFDRDRNNMGEFAPDAAGGGADSATMQEAYGLHPNVEEKGSAEAGADGASADLPALAKKLKSALRKNPAH